MPFNSLIQQVKEWFTNFFLKCANKSFVCVIGYLIISTTLLLIHIAPYNYQVSSLIAFDTQFYEANSKINPKASFKDIVVLDSGYDGQFFYLIARKIFDPTFTNIRLDTYSMRMGRIGMSLIVGLPSLLIGWNHYALISFILLQVLHIFSFLALRSILTDENKYLSLIYLFSAFSLNSNLLLVSDSLMVSIAVISYYFLEKAKFRLNSEKLDTTNIASPWFLIAFLCMCILVTIRETALFALAPIGLLFLFRRSIIGIVLMLLPALLFIGWHVIVKLYLEDHPGLNPEPYSTKYNWPLLGFFQSLNFQFDSVKAIGREASKYLNVAYLFLLLFSLKVIRSTVECILFSPIILIILLSLVATSEYWQTFANISRMFTLSVPIIIILADRIQKANFTYLFLLNIIFTILLWIRIVWLTPIINYRIINL